MKKSVLIISFLVISILFLSGCEKEDNSNMTNDLERTEYVVVNDFSDVSMTIKDESISPLGLTVVFSNDSDNQCIYGEFFSLEQKINNEWYQLPVSIEGDYGFEDIGYNLEPGGSEEFVVDWEWLYGNLDVGEYRIVKDILDFRGTGDFDKYYLAAEFSIKE